jgi:hypothetical protein
MTAPVAGKMIKRKFSGDMSMYAEDRGPVERDASSLETSAFHLLGLYRISASGLVIQAVR